MGTAVNRPVPDRVKPSFVIFNILSVRVPGCQKLNWRRFNPVWHRMLFSCTHMATVGVKELFYGSQNWVFPLPASAIVAFFARDIFSSVYEYTTSRWYMNLIRLRCILLRPALHWPSLYVTSLCCMLPVKPCNEPWSVENMSRSF